MGWNDVSLVDVSPGFENLPAGEYTFEVVGAKYRTDKDGKYTDLSVDVAVAGGEYAGRHMFADYPDPDRISSKGKAFDWSKNALKRLEQALGLEQLAGEDLVDMLNRGRGNHFGAPVKDDNYTNQNGEEIKRTRIEIFKVRPAA